MEQKFQGHFAPGSVSSREQEGPGSEWARERNGPGAKVPGSELARVSLADSLRGANWPRSEKAVNHELLMDSEESACPEQRFRPNEGGSGRGSSSVNVTSEKCVVCDLT